MLAKPTKVIAATCCDGILHLQKLGRYGFIRYGKAVLLYLENGLYSVVFHLSPPSGFKLSAYAFLSLASCNPPASRSASRTTHLSSHALLAVFVTVLCGYLVLYCSAFGCRDSVPAPLDSPAEAVDVAKQVVTRFREVGAPGQVLSDVSRVRILCWLPCALCQAGDHHGECQALLQWA